MIARTPRRWPYAVAALLMVALVAVPSPASAESYVAIKGAGSSWAAPAIDAWSTDVHPQGIVINFTASGSAAGRQAYTLNEVDFAATDIAFLTQGDPFGGGIENSSYAYSYIPIVAGGTALMYNLKVGNQKITNLRLSGDTIVKIFTGKITNWSDPAITRDYGAQLPSQKITVVTRSDGSGATYQFTRWMSKQYASQWNAFCGGFGVGAPCPPTEFYPKFTGSVQRQGSDQVANYVASPSYGVGSIGYDEYAYALNNGIPVVKVLNAKGYYALPTPSNVAIALQKAVIDEDPTSVTFLMQNLDQVYSYDDPRTYPISSYSYLVVPRDSRLDPRGVQQGPPPAFNTDKGKTLTTWIKYVLCGAQQSAGRLGYSPLPKNLVVGGFNQMGHVPGSVPVPDTSQLIGCNNPTYSDGVNHLIAGAPQPSPCDFHTAPLNCVVSNGQAVAGGNNAGSQTNGSVNTGASNGATAGGTNPSAAPGAGVDPDTGQVLTDDSGTGGDSGTAAHRLADSRRTGNSVLVALTALELAAAMVAPAVIGARLRRRRTQLEQMGSDG
ncbi:phosphate ABC transporter substrate-binding protein PstS [Dactylosporangium sp. CA-233914]|uniref:phosphate ABC transporter substrate-binding protein PstS n=1 Tax=Dactylosporangium sp. CA-233914 TaxID=3239934 RepID=UPI003D8B7EBA